MSLFLLILDSSPRFLGSKFGVSEFVHDIQDSSHLCAQQNGILYAENVKYFPCTQGGVLSIDRSRLFMAGRYVQLTMHRSSSSNIHLKEMEVHGY